MGQIIMQTTGVFGKIILKIRLGTATKGQDFRIGNKISSIYFLERKKGKSIHVVHNTLTNLPAGIIWV